MIDSRPISNSTQGWRDKASLLTICREKEVRLVLAPAPANLVDLFLNLERLEVVKFGLVRLEFGVELVFACLFLALMTLKEHHTPAFVTRSEVVACMVELDS